MPTYSISGPDGKTYSIDGPVGATKEQVIAKIQSQMGNQKEPQMTKKQEDDPLRIASMYSKAVGTGLASTPDIPAMIYEAPGALTHPAKPGAPFVENLQAAVERNPLAPKLGEKAEKFIDEKTGGMLKPQTPQGKVAVSAVQGGAAGAPFGPFAALRGAAGGGINEYALQQGASPDQAAALGLISATPESVESLPKITSETIKHVGEFNKSLAAKIESAQKKPGSELHKQMQAAGIKLTGDPKTDAEAIHNWFEKSKGDVANKISKGTLDPDKAQAGISNNYFKVKKQAEQEYAKATKIGEGKSIVATGLQNKMESLIAELKEKSFLEDDQKKALDRLDYLRKRTGEGRASATILDETGRPLKRDTPQTINYNDLVDLKQVVNELYDKKNPSHHIGALSDAVDEALSQAARQTPEFGEQLERANNFYGRFKQELGENKVLGQVWNEQDAYALKRNVEKKMPLPDETRKRAAAILNKIKTPVDLDAVTRHMPEAHANDLRAAKVNEILGKAIIQNTGIEENRPLLNALVKNDPKAMAALDKIDTLAKELAKRGIKSEMSVEEKNVFRKLYAVVANAAKGPKGMAIEAVKNAVNPPANNEMILKNLAKEVKKGAPGPKSKALDLIRSNAPMSSAEEALQ